MKPFLIQTINNDIPFDFSFHLIQSIHYHNWFYNDNTYQFIISENTHQKNCIPVGSLEFVFSYMEEHLSIKKEQVTPLNVPKELQKKKFLKREYEIKTLEEFSLEKPTFIKSNTQYKSFTDVKSTKENIPHDTYAFSDVIEIDSEWRSFVFNKKLVGLNHYSGDFTLFPDIVLLNEMIETYHDSPPAYTLDIGVNKEGTFIIETHPFVSCGLYGFHDYRILPSMFIQGFNHFIKQEK